MIMYKISILSLIFKIYLKKGWKRERDGSKMSEAKVGKGWRSQVGKGKVSARGE